MTTGLYVRCNAVNGRVQAGLAVDHDENIAEWLRKRRYTSFTNIERGRLLSARQSGARNSAI